MSEYSKLASSVGDQYLESLAETQEAFLKAVAPMTEWASTVNPPKPVGFAADFPTLQEITEANFSFASKLLKQQKKFAEKLFAAAGPASS